LIEDPEARDISIFGTDTQPAKARLMSATNGVVIVLIFMGCIPKDFATVYLSEVAFLSRTTIFRNVNAKA